MMQVMTTYSSIIIYTPGSINTQPTGWHNANLIPPYRRSASIFIDIEAAVQVAGLETWELVPVALSQTWKATKQHGKLASLEPYSH